MVRLTKFNKIQTQIDELAKQYENALKTGNNEELEGLKAEYKRLRVLLRSNNHYFANLDETKLEKQRDLKLKEQQVYKNNEKYITMVENSMSIEDYMKNNNPQPITVVNIEDYAKTNNKKFNFIRKNWKKVAATAALMTALMASLVSCSNKNKAVKTEPVGDTIYSTDASDIAEKTIEDETITLNELKTTKSNIKLNAIPKNVDANNKGISKSSNVKYNFDTTGAPEESVVEIALDPHVSNSDKDTKKVTKTEILKEKEAKEPEAVDYKIKEKDNTTPIPKKEKVTVTEVEETTTPSIPASDESTVNPTPTATPDNTFIPEKEIVTVVEEVEETEKNTDNIPVEETENTTDNIPVEETEKNTDNIPVEETENNTSKTESAVYQEAEDEEEIVTIIEEVEETEKNIDDIPVEEEEYTLKLVK